MIRLACWKRHICFLRIDWAWRRGVPRICKSRRAETCSKNKRMLSWTKVVEVGTKSGLIRKISRRLLFRNLVMGCEV